MRVIVGVKRVVDYAQKVRVLPSKKVNFYFLLSIFLYNSVHHIFPSQYYKYYMSLYSTLYEKGIELKNVKMSMNPFCEIATEAAVQLKVLSFFILI